MQKKWYGAYYNPSNCTIIITGAFRVEQARQTLEKVFAGAKDTPLPIYRPVREQPDYHIEAKVYSPHGSMLCIGYKGPSGLTREAVELCVLREIMNDNTQGWLKDGPGRRTEAVWNRGKHQALFAMITWLGGAGVPGVRKQIEGLLRRVPTVAEVQRARESLSLAWAASGSSRETAEDLAECVALGNVLDCVGRIEVLNQIDARSVHATMVKYFQEYRQALVHMERGEKHPPPGETPLHFNSLENTAQPPILYPFKQVGEERIFVSYSSGKAYLIEYIVCSDGAAALAASAHPVVGGIQREVKPALGGILVTYTFPEGVDDATLQRVLGAPFEGNQRKAQVELKSKLNNAMHGARYAFSRATPRHFGQHSEHPVVPSVFHGEVASVSYTGPKKLFQRIRKTHTYSLRKPHFPEAARSKGRLLERSGFGEVTWVRMGWLVPFSSLDPRYAPLKVAVSQLGLGMQCDVMQELRIRQNLTYTAAAQCQPVGNSTMIVCSASFAGGKYKKGVEAMKRCIGKWLGEGLKKDWASETYNHGFLGLDGRRQQAESIHFDYYQPRFISAYNTCTEAQVREALEGLSLDNLTVVAVGTLD